MICVRCSQDKDPHPHRSTMCVDCAKADAVRVQHNRNNHNWMEIAKEAQLEVWERQPQETDHEYAVWIAYRDAYPGKRPTYRSVAEQLDLTPNAVKHIGLRWDFAPRMQAWVKHVDEITMRQREQEILDMNEQHIDMAARLNAKISKAIDLITVDNLSPREINSLMKTATELEKKARLDIMTPGKTYGDDNPELKKNEIKNSEIGEIIKILNNSGMLGTRGVKQTVTTEVVMKDE